MIITTTPYVEGQSIQEFLDIVTREAILDAQLGRDYMASLIDIVDRRYAEYEEEVRKARAIAMEEMSSEADRRGANAVVDGVSSLSTKPRN